MTTNWGKPGLTVPHAEGVIALRLEDFQLTASAAVAEVIRQDSLARRGKFGGTHILPGGPDHARLAVLVEEVGEIARELNESFNVSIGLDREALVRELIQVAACSIAWATALEHEHGEQA